MKIEKSNLMKKDAKLKEKMSQFDEKMNELKQTIDKEMLQLENIAQFTKR